MVQRKEEKIKAINGVTVQWNDCRASDSARPLSQTHQPRTQLTRRPSLLTGSLSLSLSFSLSFFQSLTLNVRGGAQDSS